LELTTHIKELEKMLLLQSVRLNADILNVLISDDFLEIGESGNIWSKQTSIEAMKTENFAERTISDFKLIMITDNVVLATYKAHRYETETMPASDSIRCSIWKQFGVQWKIVYHHGTQWKPE
jgi:hypothetical protein